MRVAIIIVILIASIVGLFFYIRHRLFLNKIKWHFEHNNVIIFGYKSTGKDVVTNWIINQRNEPYYANMSYTKDDKNFMPIEIKDLSLAPNTPHDFIEGKVYTMPHKLMERTNCYISDIQVHLPNYLDSKLYVKYPSLPIFYPLSSQLYDMNVIFNCQDINRGWKALREQADYFIWTKRTYKLFGWLFTRVYGYEKYETAQRKLLPVKSRFFNKFSKAEVDIYNATNGEIITGFIVQNKRRIYYDTRHFEKLLLTGERIENTAKRKSRR